MSERSDMIKRRIKVVAIWLAVLLAILIAIFAYNIWYTTFDVRGLVFYDDSEIADIYMYEERIYLVTVDGRAYVAGEYDETQSRTYRNSEFHKDNKLKTPAPVLIYNGEVREIIPYSSLGALIITADNELYNSYDMNMTKISENVRRAYRDTSSDKTYVVDTDGKLFCLEDAEFIYSGIVDTRVYQGRVFALTSGGDLVELSKSVDVAEYVIFDTLFTGVSSFEVIDTHIRHDGDRFVYDDKEGLASPLITVLTDDGELYVKGAYNLMSCATTLAEKQPEPKLFCDWEFIDRYVESASTAPMGTVIRHYDGSCAYYGFELRVHRDSGFGYTELPLTSTECVLASRISVCVKNEDGNYYFWGSFPYNFVHRYYDGGRDRKSHFVFSDVPLVWDISNG